MQKIQILRRRLEELRLKNFRGSLGFGVDQFSMRLDDEVVLGGRGLWGGWSDRKPQKEEKRGKKRKKASRIKIPTAFKSGILIQRSFQIHFAHNKKNFDSPTLLKRNELKKNDGGKRKNWKRGEGRGSRGHWAQLFSFHGTIFHLYRIEFASRHKIK